MGHGDEELLASALDSGAGYVGLVASAKRAATVLAELRARGPDEESVLRVRAPAGLDLGPSSQEEIAVAILAELVAWRHTRARGRFRPRPRPSTRLRDDRSSGSRGADRPRGRDRLLCSEHCRARFEAEPDRYSVLRAS